jgi:formiminotetrahydrofolate cyclodeaminase
MESQMLDKSCKDFLTDLASKEPTPGGGGAPALAGAIAAALTSMVSNLTLGKGKFAAVEGKIRPILVSAEILRTRMLALVVADAAVFENFMRAYRLSKSTEEEKRARSESIQIAAYDASEVPLKIADSCLDILHISSQLMRVGNPSAITDATVAALLARAALRSACYNVHSNLLLLKDKSTWKKPRSTCRKSAGGRRTGAGRY